MTKLHFSSLVSALALMAVVPVVHADPSLTPGVYAQYGKAGSESNTNAYTVGVTKPMDWFAPRNIWGTQATGYWDLYGTRYISDMSGGGAFKTWLVGLTPTFRLRFDEGRSPFFVDGGVGVSYSDVRYRSNTSKEFSTRFNFGSHVAAGYSFGAQRDQEISLRIEHYSNASIKKPNPGENYLEVRYAHAF